MLCASYARERRCLASFNLALDAQEIVGLLWRSSRREKVGEGKGEQISCLASIDAIVRSKGDSKTDFSGRQWAYLC